MSLECLNTFITEREGIHIFSFLVCLEEFYVVCLQWKHLFRLLMNTERDVFMEILEKKSFFKKNNCFWFSPFNAFIIFYSHMSTLT